MYTDITLIMVKNINYDHLLYAWSVSLYADFSVYTSFNSQ